MAKTVIGILENADEAKKAVEELLQSGIDRQAVGGISAGFAKEAGAAARRAEDQGAHPGMARPGLGRAARPCAQRRAGEGGDQGLEAGAETATAARGAARGAAHAAGESRAASSAGGGRARSDRDRA